MTPPNFSFDVNLGQVLVVGAVSALGWGLRKIYKMVVAEIGRVMRFIERIHENDELLDATAAVVDDHSRVLIKEDLMEGPIVRLQRRKRHTDPAVFTKNNLS